MTSMVNDLLDAARLATGKIVLKHERVALDELVQAVLDVFQQTGRVKHVAVSTQLQRCSVMVDRARLEQVVANLIDNAAKYTPPGGHIEIACKPVGDDAELSVTDSGMGMEPELLARLFETFSQGTRSLDRSQGGLGLGLHLVRRIVELHGGTVAAQSAGRDHGSTFRVSLPAVPLPASDEPADSPASQQMEPLRVTVVDDSADNCETVAMLLRLHGHHVLTALDGAAGIDTMVGQNSDVALIDIGLPHMDGFAVARKVKQLAPRTVLIALSGYGQQAFRDRALEEGFDAYMQKPFEVEAFHLQVRAVRQAKSVSAADA